METIYTIFLRPFELMYQKGVEFLPVILSSIFVIIAGVVVAKLLAAGVGRLLEKINFDDFCGRTGIDSILRKGGINKGPSKVSSLMVFWAVFLFAILIAIDTLQISAGEHLIEQFLLYLPRIASSLLILIVGQILANFLSEGVLIACVNSGIKNGRFFSVLVKAAIYVFVITMVLTELNIAKEIVILTFAALAFGTALAFGIAFGLAGRHKAKEWLEHKMGAKNIKMEEKDEFEHL